ncbi:uncharacterized protein KGF55_001108 [Candida pseudojiufengensis]|uniref:uncharacterized protein n=1 Tax=Candida pseudojiufengensis TaxID=497109 RepID=UPI002225B6BD|nr:uncharacterized protein KGF55_001108 [Candida pseudojiufengensis]KAI5965745.1 hypothetical protein KGF55_001108 [Candida pseudojiufengensis]
MISPKYSLTHYYLGTKALSSAKQAPHIVNLYFDYNCPFSAKLYLKLLKVIPQLQSTKPDQFQFVYVNVIQPWHTNSTLLNEFGLAYAKVLREKQVGDEQTKFWNFNKVIYENKEKFYDNSNIELNRNEIYKQIYDVVSKDLELGVSKDDILNELLIKAGGEPSNSGNGATTDVKYFTRYLRTVGVHITPTVTIDGIADDSISSGSSEEELIKSFSSKL